MKVRRPREVFYALPLLSLPWAYWQVKMLTSGEGFIFSRETGAVEKDGERSASFGEVARAIARMVGVKVKWDRSKFVSMISRGDD